MVSELLITHQEQFLVCLFLTHSLVVPELLITPLYNNVMSWTATLFFGFCIRYHFFVGLSASHLPSHAANPAKLFIQKALYQNWQLVSFCPCKHSTLYCSSETSHFVLKDMCNIIWLNLPPYRTATVSSAESDARATCPPAASASSWGSAGPWRGGPGCCGAPSIWHEVG